MRQVSVGFLAQSIIGCFTAGIHLSAYNPHSLHFQPHSPTSTGGYARFDAALDEISRTKPWATMNAGAVNEFGGWQLEAREVSAAGDELKGVLLWAPDVGETIFARRGTLGASVDGSIEITLHDGMALLHSRREPRLLRFESVTTVLPESDSGLERSDGDRIPQLPLAELIERAMFSLRPCSKANRPASSRASNSRF